MVVKKQQFYISGLIINNQNSFDKKIYDEKYRDTKINNGAFFECDLLNNSIKEIDF